MSNWRHDPIAFNTSTILNTRQGYPIFPEPIKLSRVRAGSLPLLIIIPVPTHPSNAHQPFLVSSSSLSGYDLQYLKTSDSATSLLQTFSPKLHACDTLHISTTASAKSHLWQCFVIGKYPSTTLATPTLNILIPSTARTRRNLPTSSMLPSSKNSPT